MLFHVTFGQDGAVKYVEADNLSDAFLVATVWRARENDRRRGLVNSRMRDVPDITSIALVDERDVLTQENVTANGQAPTT